LGVLRHLDRAGHVITEGSSEDAIVPDMAIRLGFRNVHFSPRGGGLGWAMPLGVRIGLATGKHAVCFVSDGRESFLDLCALDGGEICHSIHLYLFCEP
jgi:benzoylformate decarboxylase